MKHTYKIKYHIAHEIGNFTSEEIKKHKNNGGTDAIIVNSLLFPPDGSFSHNFYTIDGRTGKGLDDIDVFKAWCMMGFALKDREGLLDWHKEILDSVHKQVAANLVQIKEQEES